MAAPASSGGGVWQTYDQEHDEDEDGDEYEHDGEDEDDGGVDHVDGDGGW